MNSLQPGLATFLLKQCLSNRCQHWGKERDIIYHLLILLLIILIRETACVCLKY